MSRVDEVFRRVGGTVEEPPLAINGRTFEAYPAEDDEADLDLQIGSAALPSGGARVPPEPAAPATSSAPTSRELLTLTSDVSGRIVIAGDVSPASVEEYRRLAAALHLRQGDSRLRTLMVSSAMPRDGKTLTSTNLSLTLSESYKRRVLLIDADLRRPSLHELFRLPNKVGLSDGLRADLGSPLPLVEVSRYLTVLPAGRPDPSPMAGLTSNRMKTILADAAERFDWVIVDTPPVGLLSDAHLLAAFMDGVLLVISAGSTPFPSVKRALAELGLERIVGVVLNRVIEERSQYSYYDYYGYGSRQS